MSNLYADLYVDLSGNDTTGVGSYGAPYQSISAAITKVLANADYSISKRYVIHLFSGIFTADVALPAWTSLQGVNNFSSIIIGNLTLDTTGSWNNAISLQCSVNDITFAGNATIDFSAIFAPNGEIQINDCVFVNELSIVGYTASNLAMLKNTLFNNGISIQCITLELAASYFVNEATITIVNSTYNIPTIVEAICGGTDGGLSLTYTNNDNTEDGIFLYLVGFDIEGDIVLDGANIYMNVAGSVLPTALSLLNGAPIPITTGGQIIQFYTPNIMPGTLTYITAGNPSTFSSNIPLTPSRIVQKLKISVVNNTLSDNATITVYNSGTPTDISLVIPAGETGLFTDTAHISLFIEANNDTLDIVISCPSYSGGIQLVGTLLLY